MSDDFEEDRAPAQADPEALLVDVEGYEGPLDVLLALARTQKVDLRHISILTLAEQYLSFISAARRLRLDLAADYLVAAAWLAYLKSRLLLPSEPDDDEPDAEEMAARLAFQLQRLEAMRKCAARLMARDRLGRDVFVRGLPDRIAVEKTVQWRASVLDLVQAYARRRTREAWRPLHVARPRVYAMEEALKRLASVLGEAPDWTRLEMFLPEDWREPRLARSAIASTFAASLELAREGALSLRQEETFGPIYIRRGAERVP